MSHPPSTNVAKAASLLILAALIAYSNSFSKKFILDDEPWIVASDSRIDDPIKYMTEGFGVGRPVVALTLLFNYHTSKLDTTGYHVVNLTIHVLAALALFGIVRRTLLLDRWPDYYRQNSTGLAFAVALLWMVHPLQTQSVTYIIQRCESLMGLFFLLTLYCAIRAWDGPRRGWWHLAAVVSCALGAGSKEVIVGAPILVMMFDRIFLADSWRHMLHRWRWQLYLGLFATWVFLGYLLMLNWGAGTLTQSWIDRLRYALTQQGVILYYLRLSFWPHRHCLDYQGWPNTEPFLIGDWLLPLGVVLFLGLATLWGLYRRSWLGFVGAWFFIVLGPTSSIMVIPDVIFEHRMYLSLASVVVVAVVFGDWLLRRLCMGGMLSRPLEPLKEPEVEQGPRKHGTPPSAGNSRSCNVVRGAVLWAVAVTLMVLTFRRNEVYRSGDVMWADVVNQGYGGLRPKMNLSIYLHNTGQHEASVKAIESALQDSPYHWLCLWHRGILHWEFGEVPQAIEKMETAMKLPGGDASLVYPWLGRACLEVGRTEWAVYYLWQTRRIAKDNAENYFHLALALSDSGRPGELQEAEEALQQGLEKAPEVPAELNRRARREALTEVGRNPNAKRRGLLHARVACLATRHEDPECLDTLAIARAANGQYQAAIDTARKALAQAREKGRTDLAEQIKRRLRLFEQKVPYRKETAHADQGELLK